MGTNGGSFTAKKVISTIISLVMLAISIVVLIIIFKNLHGGIFGASEDVLEKVKNIRYDSYYFSWDGVEHADSYIAEINGEEAKVSENKIYHIPLSQRTEIKVRPVDSTGVYASPSWSEPYVYVLGDEFSYSAVGAYITSTTTRQLKKVVSAYVKDNSLYTNAVFLDSGELKLIQFQIKYDERVSSLADCISKQFSVVSIKNAYPIADYDSANYFLQSNSYVGELEARRLEGYSFSVVISQVTKFDEENDGYNIFAIYKLTKGDEVKYVASNVSCGIFIASSNEKVNYTTKLWRQDEVRIREYSYNELKGDEVDLAIMMENLNPPQEQ